MCRDEVNALRGVRADLAAWTPPHPNLGFRIVQDRKPSWRAWWFSPAFGLAAAALIVLAAASALAHVQVSYGPDGVVIRAGRSSPPAARSTMSDRSAARERVEKDALAVETNTDALGDIRRRLTNLEVASRLSPAHQSAAAGARISDAEILRRVRELVAQSESRQLQELALRISQVMRDVDAQRVADLTRIQQGFGRIDAMTTAEAAAHRDLANYILTSSKQQK
jgi:hypothetical protein